MSRRRLSMWIRCAGKKPVKIEPGQRLRIGRHDSNDLVLNDGTVSRFHAVIVWDPDEDRPYVRDNDSANGVEVNGDPIEERRHLNGGDSVSVGDFKLSLELRVEQEERAAALQSSSDDEVTLFADKGRELQGDFDDRRSLRGLFLELEDQRRTGTLELVSEGQTGHVVFSLGKVVMAELSPATGRDALRKLLDLGRVRYHFTRAIRPGEANLDVSSRAFIRDELDATRHS